MSNAASAGGAEQMQTIKNILSKLPVGGKDEKMAQGEQLQSQSQAYRFNPDDVAPKEVQDQLLALLKWRDGVYRDILKKISMVPGLTDLIEELTNALNAYVYTIIAPWVTVSARLHIIDPGAQEAWF